MSIENETDLNKTDDTNLDETLGRARRITNDLESYKKEEDDIKKTISLDNIKMLPLESETITANEIDLDDDAVPRKTIESEPELRKTNESILDVDSHLNSILSVSNDDDLITDDDDDFIPETFHARTNSSKLVIKVTL